MDNSHAIAKVLKRIAEEQRRLSDAFEELARLMVTSVSREPSAQPDDSPEPVEGSEEDADFSAESVRDEERVEQYLTRRGLTVQSYTPHSETPEIWQNIARFIASNYKHVAALIYLIKKNQATQYPFTMNLRNFDQETIAYTTQLAHMAHQSGLLPEFVYFKSPRYQLRCAPPSAPDAINFFTGGWLETYIYHICHKLWEHLDEQERPAMLGGIHVTAPNGDQIELDLCILTPEDRLIWVEAKTGDFQPLLPKYKSFVKLLGVRQSDALLVNPNYTANDPNAPAHAKLAGMSWCTIAEFPDRIRNLCGLPEPADSASE